MYSGDSGLYMLLFARVTLVFSKVVFSKQNALRHLCLAKGTLFPLGPCVSICVCVCVCVCLFGPSPLAPRRPTIFPHPDWALIPVFFWGGGGGV